MYKILSVQKVEEVIDCNEIHMGDQVSARPVGMERRDGKLDFSIGLISRTAHPVGKCVRTY